MPRFLETKFSKTDSEVHFNTIRNETVLIPKSFETKTSQRPHIFQLFHLKKSVSWRNFRFYTWQMSKNEIFICCPPDIFSIHWGQSASPESRLVYSGVFSTDTQECPMASTSLRDPCGEECFPTSPPDCLFKYPSPTPTPKGIVWRK